MLSNNSAESQAFPQAYLLRDAEAGAAKGPVALLNPEEDLEVAPGGGGAIHDPSGTGGRPPVTVGLDPLLLA